jgi:hypothetical protein
VNGARDITTATSVTCGYDARLTSWYKSGISTRVPGWSSVHQLGYDTTTDSGPAPLRALGVTHYIPLYSTTNSSDIVGVIGVDVSLRRLSALLSRLAVSNNGIVYLADGQGGVLATSLWWNDITATNEVDQRTNYTIVMDSLSLISSRYGGLHRLNDTMPGELVELSNVGEAMLAAVPLAIGPGATSVPFNDSRAHSDAIMASSMYALDWIVIVALPGDDFLELVTTHDTASFTIGAFALVAAGFVVYFSAKLVVPRQYRDLTFPHRQNVLANLQAQNNTNNGNGNVTSPSNNDDTRKPRGWSPAAATTAASPTASLSRASSMLPSSAISPRASTMIADHANGLAPSMTDDPSATSLGANKNNRRNLLTSNGNGNGVEMSDVKPRLHASTTTPLSPQAATGPSPRAGSIMGGTTGVSNKRRSMFSHSHSNRALLAVGAGTGTSVGDGRLLMAKIGAVSDAEYDAAAISGAISPSHLHSGIAGHHLATQGGDLVHLEAEEGNVCARIKFSQGVMGSLLMVIIMIAAIWFVWAVPTSNLVYEYSYDVVRGHSDNAQLTVQRLLTLPIRVNQLNDLRYTRVSFVPLPIHLDATNTTVAADYNVYDQYFTSLVRSFHQADTNPYNSNSNYYIGSDIIANSSAHLLQYSYMALDSGQFAGAGLLDDGVTLFVGNEFIS